MKVSLTKHEAPCEVHVIDVRDAADDFLCRLFLQPTEGGCHVQIDGRPAPEDQGSGAALRVAPVDDLVLVGVDRVVETHGG